MWETRIAAGPRGLALRLEEADEIGRFNGAASVVFLGSFVVFDSLRGTQWLLALGLAPGASFCFCRAKVWLPAHREFPGHKYIKMLFKQSWLFHSQKPALCSSVSSSPPRLVETYKLSHTFDDLDMLTIGIVKNETHELWRKTSEKLVTYMYGFLAYG